VISGPAGVAVTGNLRGAGILQVLVDVPPAHEELRGGTRRTSESPGFWPKSIACFPSGSGLKRHGFFPACDVRETGRLSERATLRRSL
jgi:hypothetical protein